MTRPARVPGRRASVTLAALLMLLLPAVVLAHAELETSTPADGANVASPFDGPIVMTFSAALANGSKAELYGPDEALIASATVDGPGATMTIVLDASLVAGVHVVKWVSIGEDTDLDRGTISFTVASTPPTASPGASPTVAAPTAPATAATESSAPTSLTPSASLSASPGEGGASSGSGDVLLPIVVALILVGAGAAYLLSRRRRPTTPP